MPSIQVRSPTGYDCRAVDLGNSWDEFVHASPTRSVFATTRFLRASQARMLTVGLFKGSELRALLYFEDGSLLLPGNALVIHSGVIFGAPTTGQNQSQRTSERCRLIEAAAWVVREVAPTGEMRLHPSIVDTRPFSWANRENADAPIFKLDALFTSVLDLSGVDVDRPLHSPVLRDFSSSRRQEVMRAGQLGLETRQETDPSNFLEEYVGFMAKRGKPLVPAAQSALRSLVEALMDDGVGSLFCSRASSGEVGSWAFLADDGTTAHYLFGMNHDVARTEPTGTAVIWAALVDSARRGCLSVDLEGINDPRRGWFKTSFGGSVVPYTKVTWGGW